MIVFCDMISTTSKFEILVTEHEMNSDPKWILETVISLFEPKVLFIELFSFVNQPNPSKNI